MAAALCSLLLAVLHFSRCISADCFCPLAVFWSLWVVWVCRAARLQEFGDTAQLISVVLHLILVSFPFMVIKCLSGISAFCCSCCVVKFFGFFSF